MVVPADELTETS